LGFTGFAYFDTIIVFDGTGNGFVECQDGLSYGRY
jgi:hypothetical protein